jgi:hypothetical protein
MPLMPTLDGPTAEGDTAEVAADATVTISVLANDSHADDGAYEVAAANIFADSTATDNAGSTWTVEQTGAQPNEMNVLSAGNLGDVQIGINGQTFTPADGVLFGTMRENTDPFGTVNAYTAFSTYGFATDTGIGGGERNAPLGAAFFPFADGWVGGHVAADGTLAMDVEMAFRGDIAGQTPIVAALLRTPLLIPLKGTIDRPQFDASAIDKIFARIAANTANAVIGDGINRGLEAIFGNPQQPAPPR